MSEVINTTQYLDLVGLKKYDGLIKLFIEKGDKDLADQIASLAAKIGNLDIEGSDDKTLAEIVDGIYESIKVLGEKDAELEEDIKDIIGEVSESVTILTLAEVSSKLKDLETANIVNRITTLEGTIDDLKNLGGENGLVNVVEKVNANATAIATLTGEGAGSVKAAADAAQAAAEATAAALYQVKGNYETAGAAAEAQAAAIEAAATDATTKADTARETAIEAAATDAQAKANAAQAAAIEAAATDAQAKADAAQAAAIEAAEKYVDAISHAVNVDYDVNTQRVYLYDSNGATIGNGFDATPFIVDGMLENVSFVDDGSDSDSDIANTTLRFTFNTDSGKKEIDVDFSEYVDVYHADNSSIALDSATNTFSVKNVDATKTKTVDKIPVAGGPLAKLFEKAGIDVSDIAAGSSVEDIFKSLLCKELWPESIETDDATLTSSVVAPTVTLNGKTSGSSEVEVGTSVAYSVSSGKSSYTATPHTASNLEYGYSAADDDSVDNTNTTNTASFGDISAVSTSVPKLTLSGLVKDTIEGTAGSAAAGAVSTSGNVVIEEGTKTLSAIGTSITFTGTCSELPAVYGCSNLGKTNNKGTTYMSTKKDEITLTSTAVDSSKTSVNCVGKYKYFVGYSNKTVYDQFDSASVRALAAKSGYLTVDGTTNVIKGDEDTLTSNGTSIVIACPKKYALTNIQNGVGASILSNFSSVGEVEVATGTTKTMYTVYVYPITNGATVTFKNVTITKA